MPLEECYPRSLDDQPKDLTLKTVKKMKPIPPPLNLTPEEIEKLPMSMLKEFAMIATSPKSPLMQKHLPFRKRAHSIPVDLTEVTAEASGTTPTMVEVDESFSTCSLENSNLPPIIENHRDLPYILSQPQSLRSHLEPISNTDLTCDNFVLDLSTNASSALLSPAPSSLGSSREELTEPNKRTNKFLSWEFPWPLPVWHCFQPGCRVKVGGCWRLVEDMTSYPPDWPGELLVERISPSANPQLSCCVLAACGEMVVDLALPCHPLLVKGRGWVAVCPDTFHKRYGLSCLPLQPGDIILPPSFPAPLPLPSPDICDRIKRFSFPTQDEPPSSPVFLLSPPTTPTRKSQEGIDKPKRPMNAFMLFAKRYRLELIQTNPGKDNRAISVILGEAWRMLPQEERDKYIQGARDLSEEQKLLYPNCWKRKRSHSTS